MRRIGLERTLRNVWTNQRGRLLVTGVVIAVALVGAVALMTSHAATPFLNAEPESGTVTAPAAKVTDPAASGGSAVRFGADDTSSQPFVNGLLTSDPNYFPIAVWDQTLAANGANYKAIGINAFVGLYNGYSTAEINAASANGLYAVGGQSSLAINSSLSSKVIPAWLEYDEPDNAQSNSSGGYDPCIPVSKLLSSYNSDKTTDPLKRPVMLGFGRGVADINWVGRGTCTGNTQYYKDAASAADIFAFDIYPVNNDGPTKLQLVAQGVDNLRSWVGPNKPVWADIETTAYSQGNGTPTPAQTKFEVWSAIVHGARGINYFCHIFSPTFHEDGLLTLPDMKAGVQAINVQIASLAAVINVGMTVNNTVTSSAGPSAPIDTMTKSYGGSTYIIATDMRNTTTTGTFKPAGITSGTVSVLGENRTLTLSGGSFSDSFTGYGVHIYKID